MNRKQVQTFFIS